MTSKVLYSYENYAKSLEKIAESIHFLEGVEQLVADLEVNDYTANEYFHAAYRGSKFLLNWDRRKFRKDAEKACKKFNATCLKYHLLPIDNIDEFLKLTLSKPNSEEAIRSAIKCCLSAKRLVTINEIKRDILA